MPRVRQAARLDRWNVGLITEARGGEIGCLTTGRSHQKGKNGQRRSRCRLSRAGTKEFCEMRAWVVTAEIFEMGRAEESRCEGRVFKALFKTAAGKAGGETKASFQGRGKM